MDIKVRSFYDICCDKCGKWRSTDYNKGMSCFKADIKKQARNEGWKVKNGETVCPDCVNYINNKSTKSYHCPRCGYILNKSDVPGYDYVCYNCDENFYSFEVVD